jgi:hypothetical protein
VICISIMLRKRKREKMVAANFSLRFFQAAFEPCRKKTAAAYKNPYFPRLRLLTASECLKKWQMLASARIFRGL